MYFLNDEERRLVLRKLLPQARQQEIHPDLRGWNWHQPPLAPVNDVTLGVYEIAGRYCATRRDVYLRRVKGIHRPPNRLMVEGQILHQVMADLILTAKRMIYQHGSECLTPLERILAEPGEIPTPDLTADELVALREKVETLWAYERARILARVHEALSRQPHVGADALVALAIPVVVEQKLDGRLLGLSSHLSADAFLVAEPMIVDVKFGERRDFHRLATTGYALVMESIHEFPINIGCIVYPQFEGQRLHIERDFHLIGDELRQWFIDERDELAQMIEAEIDPGVVETPYTLCPYQGICHAVEPASQIEPREPHRSRRGREKAREG